MDKIQIGIIALFLFFGTNFAGTVSITGTCRSSFMPGNILNFTVVNTGNDTAYNVIVSPYVVGAQTRNSTYMVPSLPPNLVVPVLVPLTNIAGQGTYVDSFVLTYQQGTSTFTALFPCLIGIGNPVTSAVYLTANTTASSGYARINVTVFNGARNNYTVNVSALFPPSFKFTSSPSAIFNIGPYASRNVQFTMQYPTGQASYTGAITARYVYNNVSYSSFAPVTVISKSAAPQNSINLVLIGGAIIILAILILIARSIVKKPKASSPNPSEKP